MVEYTAYQSVGENLSSFGKCGESITRCRKGVFLVQAPPPPLFGETRFSRCFTSKGPRKFQKTTAKQSLIVTKN